MVKEGNVIESFDNWVHTFTEFVRQKGKVQPGKYRAFGYKPPSHAWNEIKNGWRHFKLMMQQPPEGSSPQKQQSENLNNEPFTLDYKKSEGEKLRQ
jgi:hypothetical protein